MEVALAIGPSLVELFAPHARDAILGDEEERAFVRVVDRAIEHALKPLADDGNGDLVAHLRGIIYSFLRTGALTELLAAFKAGLPPDIETLRERFEAQGGDPDTLLMDFSVLVERLAEAVAAGLETEARRQGSPLFNLVSLARLQDLEGYLRAVLSPAFQLDALRTAFATVNRGALNDLAGRHPSAERLDVQSGVDAFLLSGRRWCVLVGQPGVGKSVVMAQQARRLSDTGWAVLLLRGRALSLDGAARNVARWLPQTLPPPDWYRLLIAPWVSAESAGPRGLVLMIDGLDELDRNDARTELIQLSDVLQAVPADRVKVILSSGEIAWGDLRPLLPFVEGTSGPDEAKMVFVKDFDDEGLDQALRAIGSDEYLTGVSNVGRADPHFDAMRDLIRHPATFGLYAELRSLGEINGEGDLTWSGLVSRLGERLLTDAAIRCRVRLPALRANLVDLARMAHERRRPDYRLDVEEVRAALPTLMVDDSDPTRSAYAALVDRGLLVESEGPGAQRFVGFQRRDLGSYFLSFALEREAIGRQPESLGDLVARWLEDVYDYPPVVDAIFAWADRLSTEPTDPVFAALVDALLTNASLRLEVVFRLMPPASAQAILAAVGRSAPDSLAPYLKAVEAIRPRPEALTAFRRGLQSTDPRVVKLAVRAAGVHADAEAIPALVDLLDHADEDVWPLASNALGRIGTLAVSAVLAVFIDRARSPELRRRCLIALRAIGYRSEEVATVLLEGAAEGQATDAALLRSVLLTAAKLRVERLTDYAVATLGTDDWELALAGAKLLAEVPGITAGPALQEAVVDWSARSDASAYERFLLLRQVASALSRLLADNALDPVFELLQVGFETGEPLTPVEAGWIAQSLPAPSARVQVLQDLAHRLPSRPQTMVTWYHARTVAETWRLEQLEALATRARLLTDQGANLACLTVDVLIEEARIEAGEIEAADAGDRPFYDPNARLEVLRALVKCRAPGLASELSRLLPYAKWPLDQRLCDVLWAFGDPVSEEALLAKLAELRPDDPGSLRRSDAPIYALATCATERAAAPLQQYLRTVPSGEIQDGFDEAVLLPLIHRGVLNPDQLVEIIEDPDAAEDGRIASMLALAGFDARRYASLFRRVLQEVEGTIVLQGYAVEGLELAGDEDAVPDLMASLRPENDSFVTQRAALALASLEHRPAIPIIEAILTSVAESSDAPRFIVALARFKEPGSIPTLLDVMERSRFPNVRRVVIEALGEFLPDERAQSIILNHLAEGSNGYDDRAEQVAAIAALARHDPNLLLERTKRLHSIGRLDPSGRQALVHRLPWLARKDGVDDEALVAVVAMLVCDHDFWVREQAGQAMTRLAPSLSRQVYSLLLAKGGEWSTACAVRTLGFWTAKDVDIEAWRRAPEALVRDAADAAHRARDVRRNLEVLADQLASTDPGVRASVLLALEEQGDEAIIWGLGDRYTEGSPTDLFVPSIASAINRRRRDEHRKRGREEDKRVKELGRIAFD